MSLSNRFFNDRIGILGQIDSENRNRSSHNLGASYHNAPAELDSLNALSFQGLTLTDMTRLNDRTNTLFVIDVNIPKGNISYSGLNSEIDKEEISYADNYALSSEIRHYNTGQTNSNINVITETWKYEQSLFPTLIGLFGDDYETYRGNVPRLFPRIYPWLGTDDRSPTPITKTLQTEIRTLQNIALILLLIAGRTYFGSVI